MIDNKNDTPITAAEFLGRLCDCINSYDAKGTDYSCTVAIDMPTDAYHRFNEEMKFPPLTIFPSINFILYGGIKFEINHTNLNLNQRSRLCELKI